MELSLYQVDAFASALFNGNPAAVCPLKEEWLDDEVMQHIAQENNLSETAFFIEYDGHYKIRWFTPNKEVDLCGHATLASAHVLFHHLGYDQSEIIFHSKSGGLKVKKQGDTYCMDFPADQIRQIATPEIIGEALKATPKAVWEGREDWLVVLDNEDELLKLTPDFRRLEKLNLRGVIVSAPGKNYDFVSRCFYPAFGIDEDPVTGSAHTTLTPYWSERLGKKEMKAYQASSRGGEIGCKLKGDRVELQGSAITYLEGVINI
ncbi:MAG: PhzF family phenazine biosynthesis protein [Fulvivirga sp.]|nr:PhzF family phenazine biosynthesis protein [Fulvivirga sp.]